MLARASVCSSVVFVGPVLQSARFDLLQKDFSRALPLNVATRALRECKVNPLRTSGGSDRFPCGALRIFKMQVIPLRL